jgi:hypothetical protein
MPDQQSNQEIIQNIKFLAQKDITDIMAILQEANYSKEQIGNFLNSISEAVLQTENSYDQISSVNLEGLDLEIIALLIEKLKK